MKKSREESRNIGPEDKNLPEDTQKAERAERPEEIKRSERLEKILNTPPSAFLSRGTTVLVIVSLAVILWVRHLMTS